MPVSKPRILLAATGLNTDGGIAVVSRCMARALEEAASEGKVERFDRLLLLDDSASPQCPAATGEQVFARGSQPRFAWYLWRMLKRHRYDLVIFDLLGLARAIRLPLPSLRKARYAIFVHGIELDGPGGARLEALRGAEMTLANSRHTADRVAKLDPSLRPGVRVVELCIEPARVEQWQPPPADVSRECATLIVGRMWAQQRGKGHDELLQAWPSVCEAVPEAELWIVGGGDDRERLEGEAHRRGLGDTVRFFGRVSDTELQGFFQRAALFAMPSRQEGFGLVYAEAMWHGLPCIGSTQDAAGQVIEDGETGSLVPYGEIVPLAEAIVGLLQDPERARRMGAAGALRARRRFAYPRFRDEFLGALGLN